MWIWHLRTWFSGEHGIAGLMVGIMIVKVFSSLEESVSLLALIFVLWEKSLFTCPVWGSHHLSLMAGCSCSLNSPSPSTPALKPRLVC